MLQQYKYRVGGSRRWAPTGATASRATRRWYRAWASATHGPSSMPWSASRTPVRRAWCQLLHAVLTVHNAATPGGVAILMSLTGLEGRLPNFMEQIFSGIFSGNICNA
jgi:hypothetical protein